MLDSYKISSPCEHSRHFPLQRRFAGAATRQADVDILLGLQRLVLRLPDLAVDFVLAALLLEPLGGGVLGEQVVRQRGWAGSGGCAEQGRGGGVCVVLGGVVFVVPG